MHRRTLLGAAGWAMTLGCTSRMALSASDADLASLLTLIEDSPRAELPARLAGRIHAGSSRADLSAALALATARNVQPFPDVGFKYHSVMVLHAVQASMDNLTGPEAWLPLIWAADYFKQMQARERAESGWRMAPAASLDGADKETARRALTAALDAWDLEAADAAMAAYARVAAPEEIFALLFPYGARDLREIGHKAITLQNAHRLMPAFAPGQAEPLLRSAVAALLNTADDANPAAGDYAADRPWRAHQELLELIPASWEEGRADAGARADLMAALREVGEMEAGPAVIEVLRAGVGPDSVWEALFATGAELVMRQPAVVPVHAVTSACALHHAFARTSDPRARQLMLLQSAAFMPLFRRLTRDADPALRIDSFEALAPAGQGQEALDAVFAELPQRPARSCRLALGYLESGGEQEALIARARLNLARNADETHAWKFAEAAFENRGVGADADWQRRLLAASMAYLTGPAAEERNPAVVEAASLLGVGPL